MNRIFAPAFVALLLAFVVASGTLLAQSAPIRIVRATDGTLYVLKDGARYAVVAEPIGDDELASYADGGPSGAALLLNAQSAGPTSTAPADVVPEVAAPPQPADAAAAPPACQTVGTAGVVTWSFLIGGNTRSGTGTVTVTCGGASISSPIQIG